MEYHPRWTLSISISSNNYISSCMFNSRKKCKFLSEVTTQIHSSYPCILITQSFNRLPCPIGRSIIYEYNLIIISLKRMKDSNELIVDKRNILLFTISRNHDGNELGMRHIMNDGNGLNEYESPYREYECVQV